jgi:hypothetical protein
VEKNVPMRENDFAAEQSMSKCFEATSSKPSTKRKHENPHFGAILMRFKVEFNRNIDFYLYIVSVGSILVHRLSAVR